MILSILLKDRTMAIMTFSKQRNKCTLQRAISLLLLLLCFSDLAIADVFFPGLCEGKSEMRAVAIVAPVATAFTPDLTMMAEARQGSQSTPDESPAVEDDCFCCCTHILPIGFYKFSHPPLQLDPLSLHLTNIPSAPVAELFRPPKIA